MCDSAEWLAHQGTVGKAVFGEMRVLDEGMNEVPAGSDGQALVQDGLGLSNISTTPRRRRKRTRRTAR